MLDTATYLKNLAPFSSEATDKDFSSSSLLKHKGPNITGEILANEAKNDWKKMILLILQRCNVINL